MITLLNINKSYGKTRVYSDFNLEIEDGKITCILGESGSGKTTLLNMIAGITDYVGEISKVTCSYVFQSPRLVPNLTVKGNLNLVCKDISAVDGMLSLVGLTEKSASYPAELSGGQARRVALARAFLYDADIVLLDEPFSSLDLKLKIEMADLFFKLQREKGRTALLVTHDPDEAAYLSDRAIILKQGKIVFDVNRGGQTRESYGRDGELKNRLIEELLK